MAQAIGCCRRSRPVERLALLLRVVPEFQTHLNRADGGVAAANDNFHALLDVVGAADEAPEGPPAT